MAVLIVLPGLFIAYMLPTLVALARDKSNVWPLGLLNLLVGWTMVGWIVALAMACATEARAGVPIASFALTGAAPPSGWYTAPDGHGERFWSGSAWTDWTR